MLLRNSNYLGDSWNKILLGGFDQLMLIPFHFKNLLWIIFSVPAVFFIVLPFVVKFFLLPKCLHQILE